MRRHEAYGIGPARTKKTILPGTMPMAATDLMRLDFSAARRDELWVADLT